MVIPMSAPGRALVEKWLEENGKTREWLAEQLKVKRAVLWRWLVDDPLRARTPRIEHLKRIKEITGVPCEAWAEDDTEEKTGGEAA